MTPTGILRNARYRRKVYREEDQKSCWRNPMHNKFLEEFQKDFQVEFQKEIQEEFLPEDGSISDDILKGTSETISKAVSEGNPKKTLTQFQKELIFYFFFYEFEHAVNFSQVRISGEIPKELQKQSRKNLWKNPGKNHG